MKKNKQNKNTAQFLLFIVIILFAVFFLLKLSTPGNDFFENYTTNAANNINRVKSILFKDSQQTSANPVTTKSPELLSTHYPEQTLQQTSEINEIKQDTEYSPEPATTFKPSSSEVCSVPFESADNIQYSVYKDSLVCANKTSLMSFDKTGESKWAVAVSYAKPILKTSGNYILIADKDGKLINVFIENKLVYSINADNVINSANINARGDVILVTEKEQYRSCVVVYNKNGEMIFSRSIGSMEVISADISDSRLISVTLLNTDSGVVSQVQIWNINSESENFGNIDIDDTVCFKNVFAKDTLLSISEKGIFGINKRGKNIWSVFADSASDSLISVRSDKNGNSVTAFDNSAGAYLKIADINGKIRKTIPSDIIPDFVDIYSSTVAFNNGRTVFMGQYTKPLISYSSNKDIINGMIISSDTLVIVHNNSLEFINIPELAKKLTERS